MKILKYIKYRYIEGHTKEETYYKMACNNECSFEEYKRFYDFKVKNRDKKSIFNSLYGKGGEKDVSDKRNSRYKRKANRT